MTMPATRIIQLIEKNRQELGETYNRLRFITKEEAAIACHEREALLARLRDNAVFGCKETKVDVRSLSRGCTICTQGKWSCLFISGHCNCRCFYCPARQDDNDIPMTNTVPFPQVNDYVDYIRKMGFTGVSLSGGEPLLTLDTTLDYLRAVKQAFGASVYTWLYTNGTLATRETLQQLKNAGLDEIRVDIGATGLNLDAAKRATEFIETVTVEIPALPEKFETMKQKIVEMEKVGIRHLNLHQLRLTAHNLPRLLEKDYTYLHGEHVTVLGSELTALRLIDWALQEGIRLPINYCSFVYKNRFQRMAARRKSAEFVHKPVDEITENGYLRTLEIRGEPEELNRWIVSLRTQGYEDRLWSRESRKDRLWINRALLKEIDFSRFHLWISYAEARIVPAVTYRNYFVEIPLNPQRNLYVEKAPASEPIEMDQNTVMAWQSTMEVEGGSTGTNFNRWIPFERIEDGLADYF